MFCIICVHAANFECDTHRRFQCANHKCIARYQLCDGIDNCGDGSDENNMTMCVKHTRPCDPISEYACANKKCIDRLRLCDLADDCGDLSDELGCREFYLLIFFHSSSYQNHRLSPFCVFRS